MGLRSFFLFNYTTTHVVDRNDPPIGVPSKDGHQHLHNFQCVVDVTELGALKITDMKIQDMKLTDQFAEHKIAGHKSAGYENYSSEVANV